VKLKASLLFLSLMLSMISYNPNFAFAAGPSCVAPDDGGTSHMYYCNMTNDPETPFQIIDGLPVMNSILIDGIIRNWSMRNFMPGGSLGGDIESGNAVFNMAMVGNGFSFSRNIDMMLSQIEMHTGPRTLYDPIQMYPTDMFRLQGQIPPGDPDFDLLRITAGTGFAMPSPGHTTLTQLGNGNWAVDSFFDITYRIDFVGAPGGQFAGMSGSTTGTIHISSENPIDSDPCDGIDNNGNGIVDEGVVGVDDDGDGFTDEAGEACKVIGGELLPINNVALVIAGVQSTTWLIPIVLAVVGFGLVLVRRK